MSSYPQPLAGFDLGPFNPYYYEAWKQILTLETADQRYFKKTGGLITGSVIIQGSCDIGSLLINGIPTDLSVITGITAGTASASKALVLDASLNITGINTFSATSITALNSLEISGSGHLTVSAASHIKVNNTNDYTLTTDASIYTKGGIYCDKSIGCLNLVATNLTGTLQTGIQSNITQVGTLSNLNVSGILNATTIQQGGITYDISRLSATAGTGAASKALILDSSRNITNINSLSISTLTASGDIGCSNINVSGNVGTAGLNVSASAVIGGEIDCSNLVVNSSTMTTENKLLIGVSSDSTSSRRIVCLDNTISSSGSAAMIIGYNTANAGAATFVYARTSASAGYGTLGLFGSSNTIQWNSSGRVYIGASSAGVSIAERLVVAGAMQADFYYDRQTGGEPRPVFAIRNPQATDVSAGYAYVGMGSHNDTTRGLRFQRIDTSFNFDTTAGSGYATLYPAGVSNQSDYRLKTDIEEIPYGLKDIMNLKPIRYKLKYEPDDYGKRIGFLAHEVQEYIPELVEGNKDDTYPNGCIKTQSMDYASMVSVLVKAIQELNKKISDLEYKLNAS